MNNMKNPINTLYKSFLKHSGEKLELQKITVDGYTGM